MVGCLGILQGIDLEAGGRNKKTWRTAPKSENVYLKLLVKVSTSARAKTRLFQPVHCVAAFCSALRVLTTSRSSSYTLSTECQRPECLAWLIVVHFVLHSSTAFW